MLIVDFVGGGGWISLSDLQEEVGQRKRTKECHGIPSLIPTDEGLLSRSHHLPNEASLPAGVVETATGREGWETWPLQLATDK